MSTLTVYSDTDVSLDKNIIARQGEIDVDLDVVLSGSSLITLATGAYSFVDIWLPDGTVVYKGDYNGGSGFFTVVMGIADDVLEKDGIVYLQYVICDTTDRETATEVWKSKKCKAIIATSIMAYDAASNEVVPDLEMPNTYEASDVSIVDVGELFVATNVEDALQELMTKIGEATTVLTGDAENANVLLNKTFYKDNAAVKKTGTMPNNAGDNAALSDTISTNTIYLVAPEGYYDGVDDTVYADISGSYTILPVDDVATLSKYLYVCGDTGYVWKINLYDLSKITMTTDSISKDLYSIFVDDNNAYCSLSQGGGISYFWDIVLNVKSNSNTYLDSFYTNFATQSDGTYVYTSGYSGSSTSKGYIHRYQITNPVLAVTLSTIDGSGYLYGLTLLGDYLYSGGSGTQVIYKLAKDLTLTNTSTDVYGGSIRAVVNDGTNIYIAGATTQKVWKINPADLSKTTESASTGSDIYCLTCDSTHIYAGCANGYVYKFLLTDLSTVISADCYAGIVYSIAQAGSYVYVAGASVQKVSKCLKSTLDVIAQSADYGGTIRGMYIH